jgi:hypothetical protein
MTTQRKLTSEERIRLRPTVDIAALETLLQQLGPEDRMRIIDACLKDPGALVLGVSQEMAEIMSEPARIVRSRIRRGCGTIVFDAPELNALWSAVEPLPNE